MGSIASEIEVGTSTTAGEYRDSWGFRCSQPPWAEDDSPFEAEEG